MANQQVSQIAPTNAQAAAAGDTTGAGFSAGFNLLVNHPGEFFSVLWNGNADTVAPADIQQAATAPESNFGAGLGELTSKPIQFAGDLSQAAVDALPILPPISTGTKILLFLGISVVGIIAISFLVHEVNKV